MTILLFDLHYLIYINYSNMSSQGRAFDAVQTDRVLSYSAQVHKWSSLSMEMEVIH